MEKRLRRSGVLLACGCAMVLGCGGGEDGSPTEGTDVVQRELTLNLTGVSGLCVDSFGATLTGLIGPIQYVKGRADYVLGTFYQSREFTAVPVTMNKTLACPDPTKAMVGLSHISLPYGGRLGTKVVITMEVFGSRTVCNPTTGTVAAGTILTNQKLLELTQDCDLPSGCPLGMLVPPEFTNDCISP